MDTFARNALRVTLAGAGIAVIGASYVGQASADESPTPGATDSTSQSTSEAAGENAPDSSPLDSFTVPTVSDIAGL